ncbi:amino acid ABC transporter permease [Bifidobacterium rousetti]|nr:amino acid ABC transporter permease [Bifidobacterium rousetti]
MGDYFSFDRMVQVFPKVLGALPMSLLIVAVAMVAGSLIAIGLAFIRVFHIRVLDQLTVAYISFMRGTPEIVQLFLVYYGLPILVRNVFHLSMDTWAPLFFVLVTFSLNQAAFHAELFRGALEAVPKGQYEAAYTVGLTRGQAFRRIIIPQAARMVLPGLGMNLIYLFQSTSLAATIGVMDLVGKAQAIGANTYHSIEPMACATIIFTVISILLEYTVHRLDLAVDHDRKKVL